MNNPYERDGLWFFFDKSGCETGPYTTKGEAERSLQIYVQTYLDDHATDEAQGDVEYFHRKFGRPVGFEPGIFFDDVEQRRLRASLVIEEALEFVEALGFDPADILATHQQTLEKQRATSGEARESNTAKFFKPSLPKAMDAVADLIYVALGAAVTFGVNLGPIWSAVQRTNMAKVGGAVRPDGKILKPEGWQPPNVAELLWAQGWDPKEEKKFDE